MALNYDKIAAVMSQPPDRRKDFEVLNLLPWFRKKSDLFKSLKTDILFDVIKFCQFVRRPKDDILIRQGEQGDCMYILMRGKITIYIQYGAKEGDSEEKAPPPPPKEGENPRTQLGTFVVSLGQGATFGEVALLSEDCIRTASIITDEPTDLIVVDRELYNRSVKTVLEKEFEDKSNFVHDNPFFQNWPPKYKKQLTMALQKEALPYDSVLTRQGAPVTAMYFIISGEVKLTVDPTQHKSQYPKFFQQEGSILEVGLPHETEEEDGEAEDLLKTISGENQALTDRSRNRRSDKKKTLQEVCFLGVNECIGDIEVLLELDTYMQTSVCTQRTEVLVLEMKHWERLLVKRNPKTIEAMRDNLDLRLRTRSSKHVQKTVPLIAHLLGRAEDYIEQKQAQTEARNSDRYDKHSKTSRTPAQTFNDFIPSRGPLIDLYGPGTVFYKIREREKLQRKKKKPRSRLPGRSTGLASFAAVQMAKEQEAQQAASAAERVPQPGTYASLEQRSSVDYQTSDPVLTDLEERMRNWLSNDGSRAPARVMRLQRSQTEMNDLRPGVTVRVRPKHDMFNSLPNGRQRDEEFVHRGTTWVRSGAGSPGQMAAF